MRHLLAEGWNCSQRAAQSIITLLHQHAEEETGNQCSNRQRVNMIDPQKHFKDERIDPRSLNSPRRRRDLFRTFFKSDSIVSKRDEKDEDQRSKENSFHTLKYVEIQKATKSTNLKSANNLHPLQV